MEQEHVEIEIVAMPGTVAMRVNGKDIYTLSPILARKLATDLAEMTNIAEALLPPSEIVTVPGVNAVQ